MLEEEIKIGEQEREHLRVESQRLREELSDLKIEAEILQHKIKKQESRHLSSLSTDISSMAGSPSFCNSPHSTASSPMIMTPPDLKMLSGAGSTNAELHDPPSPPMSDASLPLPRMVSLKTPAPARKSRLPSAENSITPKPRSFTASSSSSRGTRVPTTSNPVRTPSANPTRTPVANPIRTPAHRSSAARSTRAPAGRVPTSNSLTHIRTLTAQMQKLEARVHSARSKLPGPGADTPPRSSPRTAMAVPPSVTIRSRKRAVGSTASSSATSLVGSETTPSHSRGTPSQSRGTTAESHSIAAEYRNSFLSSTSKHVPRLSSSGVSRLSFGTLPNRNPGPTTTHNTDPPDFSRPISRASSRTSLSSYARPPSRSDCQTVPPGSGAGIMPPPRPMSRASLSGTRTPLSRPRSSMGMHAPPSKSHGHSSSVSVSYSSSNNTTLEVDEDGGGGGGAELRTPSRRGTFSRGGEVDASGSGIPMPGGGSGIPLPSSRRQSGGSSSSGLGMSVSGRRTSGRLLEDLGETY